ncbi:hypothetical protein GIB67_036468 [Kingdonia uniflora]|uniref:Protein kinase domain-containing protein n=1 Tax=Kingdonia uniflora TaxID=39325 RepID=A0A7J7P7G5_9MAGN|nr:hypothetical protein GIB67_036468 [Kingdonia uniflora]
MPPEVELDELEKHFYKDHNIVDEGIDENAEPKNKLCDIQLVGDILEVRKLDGPEAIARKDDDLEAIVGEFLKDFQYEELETATRNFSNKLGSGGSGQVFKGILKDGTSVAVKRVEREVYGKYEFFSELSAITSAQHFNLVRLRGFVLIWKERCKVALDVAKALVYLHRDCRKQILHLDLKPENILVGDDFRGVLSDFGMSKLMSKDESSFHTEMTRGTRGYMAPEWNSGYRKEKSVDIFSYGKVLMDMFLGQRNVCFDRKGKDIYIEGGNTPLEQRKSLLYVKKKLDEKKVLDLIDKRLTKDRSIDERLASCFVKVALQCLKEDPRKRPCDMWEVLTMLEPILKVLPDDKKEEHDDEEEEEEEED